MNNEVKLMDAEQALAIMDDMIDQIELESIEWASTEGELNAIRAEIMRKLKAGIKHLDELF